MWPVMTSNPNRMLAKASCGYVPDTPNLYAKLTGRELLRFVGDLYDLDRTQVAQRTEELLRVLDLAGAADDTIDFDSHGMQQKASLASALMHDPRCWSSMTPRWGLTPIGPPDQGPPAPDGRARRGGFLSTPYPR